jgi:hypothetical protein
MDGLVNVTLFDVTLNLLEEWNAGNHTRKLGLDLMFHCWYVLEDQPQYTGYDQTKLDELGLDFTVTFNEVHDSFVLGIQNDPEMLYTVGLMAELFPWLLGDEDVWTARSFEYWSRYRLLEPNGLEPELFEGRGEYGKYFAHQLRYAREHPRT